MVRIIPSFTCCGRRSARGPEFRTSFLEKGAKRPIRNHNHLFLEPSTCRVWWIREKSIHRGCSGYAGIRGVHHTANSPIRRLLSLFSPVSEYWQNLGRCRVKTPGSPFFRVY
jgi:hypothetical protein